MHHTTKRRNRITEICQAPSQEALLTVPSASPRFCNTGAQNTESHLKSDSVKRENKALVDYVRFTIPQSRFVDFHCLLTTGGRSDYHLERFGRLREEWQDQDSGHYGYLRSFRRNGITLYYDHAQGRNPCVQISGDGCRELEAAGVVRDWWNFLRILIEDEDVSITRLDVALDDREGYIDLKKVAKAIKRGAVVSRFKSAFEIKKHSLSDGTSYGTTVNFGSRNSNTMVRMYEKQHEQASKLVGSAGVEEYLRKVQQIGHWTRVEVETKDDNAEALARLLVNAVQHQGEVLAGVLRNYIDFKKPSKHDTNRSRWASETWWDEFLGMLEKLRLCVAPAVRTIEQVLDWLRHQCAPMLATVRRGLGAAGRQAIEDLLTDGEQRMKEKHLRMVSLQVKRYASLPFPALGQATGF